jgi:hypothetical protein
MPWPAGLGYHQLLGRPDLPGRKHVHQPASVWLLPDLRRGAVLPAGAVLRRCGCVHAWGCPGIERVCGGGWRRRRDVELPPREHFPLHKGFQEVGCSNSDLLYWDSVKCTSGARIRMHGSRPMHPWLSLHRLLVM